MSSSTALSITSHGQAAVDTSAAYCWRSAPPVTVIYRDQWLMTLTFLALLPGLIFCFVFGLWWVFPFAGLELAALFLALYSLRLHAGDFEQVVLTGHTLILEQCQAGKLQRQNFSPFWSTITLKGSQGRPGAHLEILSHGRPTRFGRWLSEEQARLWLESYRQAAAALGSFSSVVK